MADAIQDFSDHGVVRKHVSDEPRESAGFRCLKHSGGKRSPDALPLPFIADHQTNFRGAVVDRSEAAECDDFGAIGSVQLRQECQLPAVIHARDEVENGIWEYRHGRQESEITSPRAQATEELADRTCVAGA